jgi:parvulin-like peptidyl-prolyl isomerase
MSNNMIKKSNILRILLLILIAKAFCGQFGPAIAQQQQDSITTQKALQCCVADELLVTFSNDVAQEKLNVLAEKNGMRIHEIDHASGLYRIQITTSIPEASAVVRTFGFVKNLRPNYILAQVGNDPITTLDMERMILQMPKQLRQIYTTTKAKEDLLKKLIDTKLFVKAAKEAQMDRIPEIQHKIQAAIERTLSQEFQKRFTKGISVSETEMRAYYTKFSRAFTRPAQIKIQEIVVAGQDQARRIMAQLEAGNDFGEIAREKSIGATAQSGGQLGWFGKGRLDPAVDQAGFDLAVGEISDILKTRRGYHVIKLIDKRPAGKQPFESVKSRIHRLLLEIKRKKYAGEKRIELEKRYSVARNYKHLSEIEVHADGEQNSAEEFRSLQQMILKPQPKLD